MSDRKAGRAALRAEALPALLRSNAWRGDGRASERGDWSCMDPKRRLFIELMADGRPLFTSQSELAKLIHELPGSGFNKSKDANGVRVFLSQVLRPAGQKGARNPSPNLKSALRALIAIRLPDPVEARAITDALLADFDSIKDQTQQVRALDDELEWAELIRQAETAKRVVIITGQPAETHRRTERTQELTRLLVERVIDSSVGNEMYDKSVCYSFYITDSFEANLFRPNLVTSVQGMLGCPASEAEKLVSVAETEGRLEIFSADFGFICPVVIFDPDSSGWTAFNLYYHDGNTVSVARWNKATFSAWYNKVYQKLKSAPAHFHIKPLHIAGGNSPRDPQLTDANPGGV